MTDIAISVQNLTKIYKLYDSPKDRIKEAFHPLRRQYHNDFYALNDVSFEIKKGETVGIIGKNGSGKSTLLKILTGVLTPSSGTAQVNGKVSALLELGAGFNPELTGIENVYFNGLLMGYTREEMDAKLDDILSFADIGNFVHQPVKMYSSGMFVRLAFAAAVKVDPDILIVDEALAVGDIRFNIKCMDLFKKFRENGTTILFVSQTIVGLGGTGILLEEGKLIKKGDIVDVWAYYNKKIVEENMSKFTIDENIIRSENKCNGVDINESTLFEYSYSKKPILGIFEESLLTGKDLTYIESEFFLKRTNKNGYGNGIVKIVNTELLDINMNAISSVKFGQKVRYRVHMRINADVKFLASGFLIRNAQGINVVGEVTWTQKVPLMDLHAGDRVVLEYILDMNLAYGKYTITVGAAHRTVLMPGETVVFDEIPNCDIFDVEYFETEQNVMFYAPIAIKSKIERTSGIKSSVVDPDNFFVNYLKSL